MKMYINERVGSDENVKSISKNSISKNINPNNSTNFIELKVLCGCVF